MLVFVTGAAGFIGRAVIPELLSNGHQVLGLARNDANAEIITNLGGTPHRGELEDLESLKVGAKAADGIIHLGYIHDFTQIARSTRIDREAIAAMADAIAGTGKPLIIASGIMGGPRGVVLTEDTKKEPNAFSDRELSAELVIKLSTEKNIRGMVMRLPPTVHGAGDKGLIPRLIDIARKAGFVTYIGDGSARWTAGHRLDTAALLRLALEKGRAGATYHAVAEQGVPMKDIMGLVSKSLQLPLESKTSEEVAPIMGFLAHAIAMDSPASGEKTQKELGWHPTQPELLADLEANYFS
jgi:nucleoside-diphosphate-sugar epimerase